MDRLLASSQRSSATTRCSSAPPGNWRTSSSIQTSSNAGDSINHLSNQLEQEGWIDVCRKKPHSIDSGSTEDTKVHHSSIPYIIGECNQLSEILRKDISGTHSEKTMSTSVVSAKDLAKELAEAEEHYLKPTEYEPSYYARLVRRIDVFNEVKGIPIILFRNETRKQNEADFRLWVKLKGMDVERNTNRATVGAIRQERCLRFGYARLKATRQLETDKVRLRERLKMKEEEVLKVKKAQEEAQRDLMKSKEVEELKARLAEQEAKEKLRAQELQNLFKTNQAELAEKKRELASNMAENIKLMKETAEKEMRKETETSNKSEGAHNDKLSDAAHADQVLAQILQDDEKETSALSNLMKFGPSCDQTEAKLRASTDEQVVNLNNAVDKKSVPIDADSSVQVKKELTVDVNLQTNDLLDRIKSLEQRNIALIEEMQRQEQIGADMGSPTKYQEKNSPTSSSGAPSCTSSCFTPTSSYSSSCSSVAMERRVSTLEMSMRSALEFQVENRRRINDLEARIFQMMQDHLNLSMTS